MRAWAAPPHLAPLDWAPVVCRFVIFRTDRALRVGSHTVWSNMPPFTAAKTESVWSYLLIGIDVMSDSKESDPVSAEAVERCLS